MAAPRTSARSQAMIASSHSTQRVYETDLGYSSRQACARSRRVTMPKRELKRLEQYRHNVRHHEDPEQPVTESRSPSQVGRPVARVHIADAYEVGRTGERKRRRQSFSWEVTTLS